MSVNLYDKDAGLKPIAGKVKTDIVTDWQTTSTDTEVPSEKLVKSGLDSKVDKVTGSNAVFSTTCKTLNFTLTGKTLNITTTE